MVFAAMEGGNVNTGMLGTYIEHGGFDVLRKIVFGKEHCSKVA